MMVVSMKSLVTRWRRQVPLLLRWQRAGDPNLPKMSQLVQSRDFKNSYSNQIRAADIVTS